ncbi:uncharacterized protein LOC123542752 isoform X2 [Mercenaria mercenaria]|uniref:uncharacterized protein LOC123542752 isoform X2 n=1 Tax=Mercenaria mercenaria TaxID=6596 RepID=UPI00234F1642|nr:uncharacterized protein LOC123542752 isoform X2 [Mercenaria mercenaria]
MADEAVTYIRKFTEKLDESHHAVEDLFNNELKKNLTRSGIMDHSPEECDILIEELNKALEVVENKVNHTLIHVKDHLKQAKIDALERKLMHCTCVVMRQDAKRSRDKEKKDSGIVSTDSRVFSDVVPQLFSHQKKMMQI